MCTTTRDKHQTVTKIETEKWWLFFFCINWKWLHDKHLIAFCGEKTSFIIFIILLALNCPYINRTQIHIIFHLRDRGKSWKKSLNEFLLAFQFREFQFPKDFHHFQWEYVIFQLYSTQFGNSTPLYLHGIEKRIICIYKLNWNGRHRE